MIILYHTYLTQQMESWGSPYARVWITKEYIAPVRNRIHIIS